MYPLVSLVLLKSFDTNKMFPPAQFIVCTLDKYYELPWMRNVIPLAC